MAPCKQPLKMGIFFIQNDINLYDFQFQSRGSSSKDVVKKGIFYFLWFYFADLQMSVTFIIRAKREHKNTINSWAGYIYYTFKNVHLDQHENISYSC